MIAKVNDVKRMKVGDKFMFSKYQLVQIQSIEGKTVTVVDVEEGTVITMEFYQKHGKSYRYRYEVDAEFCHTSGRGSGVSTRFGISLGNMYDYGAKEPIRAGEKIKFRVDGIDYNGVVAAVGSYSVTGIELNFNNQSAKNAIVVIANGVERVIIGCNQSLYYVESDENGKLLFSNSYVCTIEGYRA